MYYGILVLGATIKIALFLRLCSSVSGEVNYNINFYKPDPTAVSSQLQNQTYFQEVMSKYDDTVYSWITGQKHYSIQRLLLEIFQDNEALQQYALSLFNGGSGKADHLKQRLHSLEPVYAVDDTDHSVWINYGKYNPGQLPYCSNAVKVVGNEFENLVWESQFEFEVSQNETEDDGLTDGCKFIEGAPDGDKYLLCDSKDIISFPKLPSELDVFEMNYTRVKMVAPKTFSDTEVRIVRLNRNQIGAICPFAFEGIRKTTFLQIDYNPISTLWFGNSFRGLNEVLILTLENNEISFEHVGSKCLEENPDSIELVLPKLLHLNLKGNPLKVLPKTTFAALRESPLNLLVLENCQLRSIDPGKMI